MSRCQDCQIAGPCSFHYKDGGAPPCALKKVEAAPSASTNNAMYEIAANLRGIDIDLLTEYNFIGTVRRVKNCLRLLHQ
jgi:hypothetical protein